MGVICEAEPLPPQLTMIKRMATPAVVARAFKRRLRDENAMIHNAEAKRIVATNSGVAGKAFCGTAAIEEAVAVVVTVSREFAVTTLGETLAGENAHVAPAGRPLQEKVVGCVKPPEGRTLKM